MIIIDAVAFAIFNQAFVVEMSSYGASFFTITEQTMSVCGCLEGWRSRTISVNQNTGIENHFNNQHSGLQFSALTFSLLSVLSHRYGERIVRRLSESAVTDVTTQNKS